MPSGSVDERERGRQLIRSLIANYENFDLIPVYDLFANGSDVLILDGRNIVYVDDDHLTTYGARLAAPRIEQAISRAIGGVSN